jgi:hypothetical protein
VDGPSHTHRATALRSKTMGKIDYTKVEQILKEGIRSYGVKQLLYFAEIANSLGGNPEDYPTSPFDSDDIKAISLVTLSENLKALHKIDKDIYKTLGITHKEIKSFIKEPKNLTQEQWDKIAEIKQKLDIYRKLMHEKIKGPSDDDIIASQRKKHVNKRFNVNYKWLPLK